MEGMEKTIREKEADFRWQSIFGGVTATLFVGYFAASVQQYSFDNKKADMNECISGALRELAHNPLYFLKGGYDASLSISIVIIMGLLLFVAYTYNRLRLHHDTNTIKGSAKWANLKEMVKKYADFEGKDYRNAYNNAIFSQNFQMSLNHKKHFHAMNTLILGATGTGKSRYVLKPNLLQMNCSYVVTDPKGAILNECGEALRRFGYSVRVFDLVNMGNCDTYNPLKYCTRESDIKKIVQAFMKNTDSSGGGGSKDPFWDDSMSAFLCACIGFLTSKPEGSSVPYAQIPEIVGKKDAEGNSLLYSPVFANLCELTRMANKKWDGSSGIELFPGVKLGDGKNNTANASELAAIFENLRAWECKRQDCNPDEMVKPYCLREWENFRIAPEKTSTTILMTTAVRLDPFNIEQVRELTSSDTIHLDTFGQSRDVLFVIIPTNDRTYNFLVSFLYTQMFDRIYFNCENNTIGTKNMRLPSGELVRHFRREEVEAGIVDETVEKIKKAHLVKQTAKGTLHGTLKVKQKSKTVTQKVTFEDGWYDIVTEDGEVVCRRPTKALAEEYLAELKKATVKPGHGIAAPTHIRFLLDEFANIGEIPEFKEKLATMRAYEISCTVICQSITQLKGMYEKDYEVVDANCPQTIFLGGAENTNNEYVSKKLGNTTVKGANPSVDSKKVNIGTNTDGKPLMSLDELGRMPTSQQLVMVSGEQPIRDLKYDYPAHRNYKFTNDFCCDIGCPEGSAFDRSGYDRLKNIPLMIKLETASAIPCAQPFTAEAFKRICGAVDEESAMGSIEKASRYTWESSSTAMAF